MRGLVLATALVAVSGTAQAVTFSETQYFTTAGQAFTFSFSGVPANAGGGGTLELEFKGDYEPFDATTKNVELFLLACPAQC
jgi:hypothetical protein